MEKKSIVRNSVYNIIYKLVNVLFPLISTIIVSRALLPEGVGKVSSAQNIVTYFTFAACMGLPNYGTREIAKLKDEKINVVFTELFCINSISTLLCSVAYYTLVSQVASFSAELHLYYIAGIAIVLNFFNVDWFYQGKEEFWYIAIRSCIIKIMMFFALLIFVREPTDYCKYAFIYCMAIAGNHLFNVIHLRKYDIVPTFKGLDIKKHLKPIMILFASNLAVELFSLLDVTMLTAMCSSEVVAYYANSVKLVKVAASVVTAIGGVLLPRLSFYLSQGNYEETSKLIDNVVKIILFFVIPCGIGMFCIADVIIVVLFGEAFLAAAPTLQILSLLFMVLSLGNLFGVQVLIAAGQESKVLVATIAGAVINIVLNTILIRNFQQNGAAIASVASETAVTIITYYYARDYFKLNITPKFVLKMLLSGITMGILVYHIRNITTSNLINLCISLVVAVLIYFGLNYLMGNELFVKMKKMLKNKSMD